MQTLEQLFEEFETQNAQLEAAFEQLRSLPAEVVLALPSDALAELDEACAPRGSMNINQLAQRA